MKSYMTFAIVAAVAVMLVASAAAVVTEDAFAGKKKKCYIDNQDRSYDYMGLGLQTHG